MIRIESEHYILCLSFVFMIFGALIGFRLMFDAGVFFGVCSYSIDLMKRTVK